jgi:hypothetical protein
MCLVQRGAVRGCRQRVGNRRRQGTNDAKTEVGGKILAIEQQGAAQCVAHPLWEG